MEFAVGAAQWAAQFALDKYVDSKLDEWAARSFVGDEVKSLRDYFQTSLAMLDALGHKPIPNDRFPPLLTELKFASSEADDLLDELDYYRLQELITDQSRIEMEVSQSPSFLRLLMRHAGIYSETNCLSTNV